MATNLGFRRRSFPLGVHTLPRLARTRSVSRLIWLLFSLLGRFFVTRNLSNRAQWYQVIN